MSGVGRDFATTVAADSDLAFSQMRCTSAALFDSPTYIEIQPSALVDENETNIIQFDSGTNRIEVKETGSYLIGYEISFDSADLAQQCQFALFKNGTTEIEETRVEITADRTSVDYAVSTSAPVELTAGDKVSLYTLNDLDGIRISGGCAVYAVRLKGVKGDKGDTGSGSTITVENSGTPVANTPHSELSFGTELIATDAGAGQANIDLGVVPITKGGTGQTTKTEGFDALSPTTTKGDVIVYDGSDNIRLPVGADGEMLLADAAEVSGVKWGPMPVQLEGTSYAISFHQNGNAANKWLYHVSDGETTDLMPYHNMFDIEVCGVLFYNKNSNIDVDIEFYLDGTAPGDLIYTVEVRNATGNFGHVSDPAALPLWSMPIHSDLHVFANKIGNNTINSPVVQLLFRVSSNAAGSFFATGVPGP